MENYSNITHDYPLIWMTFSCNRTGLYRLLFFRKPPVKLHRRCHKTYIWVYSYFCFKSEIKQIATFKTHVSRLHIPQSLPHARTGAHSANFDEKVHKPQSKLYGLYGCIKPTYLVQN